MNFLSNIEKPQSCIKLTHGISEHSEIDELYYERNCKTLVSADTRLLPVLLCNRNSKMGEIWFHFCSSGFWVIDEFCGRHIFNGEPSRRPEVTFTAYEMVKNMIVQENGSGVIFVNDPCLFDIYWRTVSRIAVKYHGLIKYQPKVSMTMLEKQCEKQVLKVLNYQIPCMNLYDHLQAFVLNTSVSPFPGLWKQLATVLMHLICHDLLFFINQTSEVAYCCFILAASLLNEKVPRNQALIRIQDLIFKDSEKRERLSNAILAALRCVNQSRLARLMEANPAYNTSQIRSCLENLIKPPSEQGTSRPQNKNISPNSRTS